MIESYLINKEGLGRDMGRPRKQPARIMTANLPLTTWDLMDELRLSNRSVWLNRVILEEVERENENKDAYKARMAASRKDIEEMLNTDKYVHKISDDVLFNEAEKRGIVAERFNDKRRIILALQVAREMNKKQLIKNLESALKELSE